jgi:hypothetical protein
MAFKSMKLVMSTSPWLISASETSTISYIEEQCRLKQVLGVSPLK